MFSNQNSLHSAHTLCVYDSILRIKDYSKVLALKDNYCINYPDDKLLALSHLLSCKLLSGFPGLDKISSKDLYTVEYILSSNMVRNSICQDNLLHYKINSLDVVGDKPPSSILESIYVCSFLRKGYWITFNTEHGYVKIFDSYSFTIVKAGNICSCNQYIRYDHCIHSSLSAFYLKHLSSFTATEINA